jgi:hypothetical protein
MESSKKNIWLIGSCVILFFTLIISGVSCNSGNGDGDAITDAGANAAPGESEKVIFFRDPIRIGDDQDYNATHDPDFQISKPTGLSYAESFTISADELNSSKAVIQYTIAGSMMGSKVYLNGILVGITCNPGNTADAIKECDDIDITGRLRVGNNELKIVTVLYPPDDVTPYDDIEIYNMRITLTR